MQDELNFVPAPPGLPDEQTDGTEYLIVRLDDDGHVEVQGSRATVEQFLEACAHAGLVVKLDHLSWCG